MSDSETDTHSEHISFHKAFELWKDRSSGEARRCVSSPVSWNPIRQSTTSSVAQEVKQELSNEEDTLCSPDQAMQDDAGKERRPKSFKPTLNDEYCAEETLATTNILDHIPYSERPSINECRTFEYSGFLSLYTLYGQGKSVETKFRVAVPAVPKDVLAPTSLKGISPFNTRYAHPANAEYKLTAHEYFNMDAVICKATYVLVLLSTRSRKDCDSLTLEDLGATDSGSASDVRTTIPDKLGVNKVVMNSLNASSEFTKLLLVLLEACGAHGCVGEISKSSGKKVSITTLLRNIIAYLENIYIGADRYPEFALAYVAGIHRALKVSGVSDLMGKILETIEFSVPSGSLPPYKMVSQKPSALHAHKGKKSDAWFMSAVLSTAALVTVSDPGSPYSPEHWTPVISVDNAASGHVDKICQNAKQFFEIWLGNLTALFGNPRKPRPLTCATLLNTLRKLGREKSDLFDEPVLCPWVWVEPTHILDKRHLMYLPTGGRGNEPLGVGNGSSELIESTPGTVDISFWGGTTYALALKWQSYRRNPMIWLLNDCASSLESSTFADAKVFDLFDEFTIPSPSRYCSVDEELTIEVVFPADWGGLPDLSDELFLTVYPLMYSGFDNDPAKSEIVTVHKTSEDISPAAAALTNTTRVHAVFKEAVKDPVFTINATREHKDLLVESLEDGEFERISTTS